MWFDRIKTVILLGALTGLLLLLGELLGGQDGLQIALVMALFMNGIMYFFSDKIVLGIYGAQPLDRGQFGYVYSMVEELAHTMKLPMPKLWLVHTPVANAFATGRNPRHASVAVTTGILDLLETHELRGVLAHELSHIKNRDVLVATIAATIAAAIGYLANMIKYTMLWRSRDRDRSNPILTIVLAMLMPIIAALIQLSISRTREYLADESGANACRDPLALASALEKLHNNVSYAHFRRDDATKASTASLFIVHPFTTNGWVSLFSTHPPMSHRIERLRKMYEKMF